MGLMCEANSCKVCPLNEIDNKDRRNATGRLMSNVLKWHGDLKLFSPEELRKAIWDESSVAGFYTPGYTDEDIELVAKAFETKLVDDCQSINVELI